MQIFVKTRKLSLPCCSPCFRRAGWQTWMLTVSQSLGRPSPLRLSLRILSIMLNRRSRTRRASPQTSNVWSLLESSLKMAEPFPITTFRRSRPFTWSSVFVVECKSLLRLVCLLSPFCFYFIISNRLCSDRKDYHSWGWIFGHYR